MNLDDVNIQELVKYGCIGVTICGQYLVEIR